MAPLDHKPTKASLDRLKPERVINRRRYQRAK